MLAASRAANCPSQRALQWSARTDQVQLTRSVPRARRGLQQGPNCHLGSFTRLFAPEPPLRQPCTGQCGRTAAGGTTAASAQIKQHLASRELPQPDYGPYWTSGIGPADILIVDATNRACVAAADTKLYRHVGVTLQSSFAAWLDFLRDLLQTSFCIAVFDAPRVRTDVHQCLTALDQPCKGATLWI